MADTARRDVDHGAEIIDINMGCPAKKVCNRAAGSALLRDEPLVAAILTAVVRAVTVPVTLKIRTDWSPEARNGVRIARKHIGWYLQQRVGGETFRREFNRLACGEAQMAAVAGFFRESSATGGAEGCHGLPSLALSC